MPESKTRRDFVTTSVGLGSLAILGCNTLRGSRGSPEKSGGAYGNGGAPRMGNNLNTPAGAKDLATYRTAVGLLRKSGKWETWAKLHESYCPHGNWFFLPWHRWFLFYFEESCRAALRENGLSDDFSLPYWVWHEDNLVIPPAFWGVDNPLADPTRYFTPVAQLPPETCSAEVVGAIMTVRDFEAFAGGPTPDQRGWTTVGQLEGTPHNTVHSQIGGDMGTFVSPMDPIFWVHHANVDRLWAEWAAKHPLSALPSTPGPAALAQQDPRAKLPPDYWLRFNLTGFLDPKGVAVTATPSSALDTTKMPVPYVYDTSPKTGMGLTDTVAPQPPQSRKNTLAVSSVSLRAVTAVDAQNMMITASVMINDTMKPYMQKLLAAKSEKSSLVLTILGIPVPKEPARQRTLLKFFADFNGLGKNTPYTDGHYLTTLGFFSHPDHHGGHDTVDFTIDLTPMIPRLVNQGTDLTKELSLGVIVVDPTLSGLPAVDYFRPINLRLTYKEWD